MSPAQNYVAATRDWHMSLKLKSLSGRDKPVETKIRGNTYYQNSMLIVLFSVRTIGIGLVTGPRQRGFKGGLASVNQECLDTCLLEMHLPLKLASRVYAGSLREQH